MPTRTQQGDLMMCAYASHGDTRHICLYPGRPARGVRVRGQGVRSRRALPDAGVRAERSRHRHERLDGPEADVGRQPIVRIAARCCRPRSSTKVKTFYRYLDVDGDGIPYRTLPGRASEGRVLHARLGPQPVRRLHRGRRRVRRGASTASIARFSAPPRAVPAPIVRRRAGRQDRPGHRRRLPRRLHRGARPAGRGGHRARLHARPRLPVRRRRRAVPRRARGQLRRRAEPRRRSCAAC